MHIHNLTPLLGISLLTLGCAAKALDLDAPVIEASNEPDVLGTLQELVTKIVVDDERVYWLGYGRTLKKFVQSCQKQDCAATLITYDAQSDIEERTLAVRAGQLYWYRSSAAELLSCPRAGCSGAPRSVARMLVDSTSGPWTNAFDDDRFYFTNLDVRTTISSVSLTQPGPAQAVASTKPALLVGLDDAHAYWVTWAADGGYDAELSRARKDGSSSVSEVIATDVKLGAFDQFAFGTDRTGIYWTNNQLAGSINRCPTAGCTGASESITGPVRAPQKLLIDGSDLYYAYETQSGRLGLATCELPACAQSTRLTLTEKLFTPELLALDDQYLYVATSEQDRRFRDSATEVSMNIRRLPKRGGAEQ